jgi:hypothetical protein
MKTTSILSIFVATLLAASCGTSDAVHQGHVPGAAEMGHEHEGPAVPVQLDHGQPWAANIETTEGVNRMLALVKGYDPVNGDGAALKEQLVAQFNEIFAKCTMTGAAHEQLHNYLAPVHGLLDKLNAKPTADELSELSAYLGTYGNYFH